MVQYIQSQPSFLENMLGSGIQAYQQKKQQTNQAQALGQMLGLDDNQLKQFSAMSPEAQKLYVENTTKNNAIDQKTRQAQNEQQQIMQLTGLSGQQQGMQQPVIGQEQPDEQGFNLAESMGMQQPEVSQQQQPTATQPQQQPVVTPQQQKRYTQDQINQATLINPNVGRAMQAQNDSVDKRLETIASSHNKANETYFSNISARAEALPQKRAALDSMINSIEEGDLGYFSPDNIANITGVEGLRTPKGSQFISSGKEYFLGSLKRAGSRPNQWIEQQIQKMLPQIGRSKEANLTVAEILKVENSIEEKQIALTYQLADQLQAELGYVPRDLVQRVNEQIKPFAEEQQKLLEGRLREITGEVKLNKVEKGTPINKDIAQKILAKANGDKEKARTIAKGLGYEF